MVSAGITKYDGKISGNVLVLGSTDSGKTTLVQKMTSNSIFGELRGVHWISKLHLSKQKEAEIDSCFTPKVEFYSSEDEEDLEKTFDNLENIYRERVEKMTFDNESHNVSNCMGEYVKRDSLVVLDDVIRLADRLKSFVTFITTCRKFGYSLIYVFHEAAVSSPRWKDILSQTQIFCIFPSVIDLVLNHLIKFADRLRDRYVSRQQMWLTNLVRSLTKTGYTNFCLDKRSFVSGAARYRSPVENPDEKCCYLNSSTSDKHFNAFRSRQTSNREFIEFVIEKQVGVTSTGYKYELQASKDGVSSS